MPSEIRAKMPEAHIWTIQRTPQGIARSVREQRRLFDGSCLCLHTSRIYTCVRENPPTFRTTLRHALVAVILSMPRIVEQTADCHDRQSQSRSAKPRKPATSSVLPRCASCPPFSPPRCYQSPTCGRLEHLRRTPPFLPHAPCTLTWSPLGTP
jgi:hypothetical protein